MSIQCATFDLDDTLWAIHPVISSAEKKFYEWMHSKMPDVVESYSLEELTKNRHDYFESNPDLHHDLGQLRKNWMTGLAKEYLYPIENLEEGFDVFWTERNNVALFHQAEEVLSYTQKRYTTGAITNGNADLDKIGIGQYFHFSLTSAEIGHSKPHPAIFEAAAERAGLRPQQIVHIGDDPQRDIEGAARLGMKTIWVNTHNQPWNSAVLPDAEISQISELPGVLERL